MGTTATTSFTHVNSCWPRARARERRGLNCAGPLPCASCSVNGWSALRVPGSLTCRPRADTRSSDGRLGALTLCLALCLLWRGPERPREPWSQSPLDIKG